jgi:type I restriction enzyme S subunit
MKPSEKNKIKLGTLLSSVSETHKFDKKELIFLNTSDIHRGNILHRNYSDVDNMPGQAKKSVQSGDILFSEIRPANGRWAILTEETKDFVVSTKLMVLRTNLRLALPEFMYIYLTSSAITSELQSIAEYRSATFPQITFQQVANLEIDLPSLAEQEVIVRSIKSIDDKIKLNASVSQTLEDLSQAIFKSWFVDFDSVKAKMVGQKPAGMDAATEALFPDSLDESEVGFIPKGWEIRKIESLCETLLGGTPSRTRDEFWGGEIPWINSGKVNDFRITAASEYITELGLEKSATKLLPKGTTVLAITGATLGQFSRLEIDSCANQSVVGIVGSAEASNEFIYSNIKNGIQRLISAQTGGAQQHINKEDVNAFSIVYPGKKLMDAFTYVVGGMFAEIGVLLNQSISLAEIRDSLLPRLISGELEIPEEMLAS